MSDEQTLPPPPPATPPKRLSTAQKWLVAAGVVAGLLVVGSLSNASDPAPPSATTPGASSQTSTPEPCISQDTVNLLVVQGVALNDQAIKALKAFDVAGAADLLDAEADLLDQFAADTLSFPTISDGATEAAEHIRDSAEDLRAFAVGRASRDLAAATRALPSHAVVAAARCSD